MPHGIRQRMSSVFLNTYSKDEGMQGEACIAPNPTFPTFSDPLKPKIPLI